jgi:hypothetical protein
LLGLLNSVQALTITEDFEDDPAHSFSWPASKNAGDNVPGWSVWAGNPPAPAALTPARANAVPGESFSGSQALVIAAATTAENVRVKRVSPLATGGTGFAGVAVRIPTSATAPLAENAPLVLEGMRFAFVSVTSGLARWSYWDGATWQPVAAEIAVTTDGFPVQWTRLHVRRDFSSLSEGDLWINGKPVAVKVPVSPGLSGFQIRAASTIGSYVDALTFSDHQTLFPDTDDDGMPDTWELVNVTAATANDRLADPDADTVVNIREYLAGSHPGKMDSDSDGMPDAWEILYQLNPADGRDATGDFDADGVSNLAEYESTPKTNPRVPGGNGPKVIYLKANNGSDPAKDGSWGHPYADFATALNSVPDGESW